MKATLPFLFIPLLFMLSCYSGLYYWGDYSDTLYAYKKEPSDETLKEHLEELDDIIEESKDLGLNVPPGIYCEYAYFLIQKGHQDDALQYIQLEEQTYPESKVFTDRLRGFILGTQKPLVNQKAVDTTLTGGVQ